MSYFNFKYSVKDKNSWERFEKYLEDNDQDLDIIPIAVMCAMYYKFRTEKTI